MKGDQIDQVRDEAQLKQSQLFSHLANGLIGEPTVEDITLYYHAARPPKIGTHSPQSFPIDYAH